MVRSPFFLAITLAATSLGMVIPVVADAGLTDAVFSGAKGGAASNIVMFGIFGAVVAVVGLSLGRAGRNLRLEAFLTRLQDTTAEIRVRIAVALLIGFVALAANIGLQTILGAFLAGVVLNLIDRDTASHPVLRAELDALGYGFLVPVFFVSSGCEFDLSALMHSPAAAARIPLFLLALLLVRGAPAALYVRAVGRRGAVTAGFLQATSLPVIVTAASIGVAIGAAAPVTAVALVSAGLLSVLVFPLVALAVAGGARNQSQPVQQDGPPRTSMQSVDQHESAWRGAMDSPASWSTPSCPTGL